MKTLVYAVAIGEEYVQQARVMVESLRHFGQYEGEIWVYGDGRTGFTGATSKSLVGYDELSNWCHFHRILIGAHEDLSGFDRVLYVDADVLFVAPVACFWERVANWCPVACFEEKELVGGMERHYLERGAAPRPGRHGLNSGTIVAEGVHWPQICGHWLRESRRIGASDLRCKDQHSWNTLLFGSEAHTPSYAVLPREWVWFPGEFDQPMSSDMKILHCNGVNKFLMMRTVSELLRLPRVPRALG